MNRDARRAGTLALVVTALLWGTTGTAASFLPSVPAVAIGAATMGVGGALLLVTAPRASARTLTDALGRRESLIGAVAVVVYPLAFYSGMREAGVAVGNVVALGSGPVFAAVLERLLDGQRLTRRWVVAAVVSIAGVATLALGGGGHTGSGGAGGSFPLGVVLALVAGLAYALYTNTSSRAIRSGLPSRGVLGATFGVAAPVLLAVFALTGAAATRTPTALPVLAYLAIGPMFLAYLLFGVGLRRVRGSTATLVTLLEPVTATVLAVVVVHERLAPLGWTGLGLVALGIVIAVVGSRQRRDHRRMPLPHH